MFPWSRPACPVDAAAKRWIEDRLTWLVGQFGFEVLRDRPVVLPTAEFFPDPYDGSRRSVRALLDRVCARYDVAPQRVSMKLFTQAPQLGLVNDRGDNLPSGFAGLFEEADGKFIVRVESSAIQNLMELVGTIAHELAHVRLLGERRVRQHVHDHELLTDLTTVFHGFGIFLANYPRHWHGTDTFWPGTKLRKPEYMSLPMYGYALAHVAWLRSEERPTWANHLRPDARAVFKQGLRYLQDSGNSALSPLRSPRIDGAASTDAATNG